MNNKTQLRTEVRANIKQWLENFTYKDGYRFELHGKAEIEGIVWPYGPELMIWVQTPPLENTYRRGTFASVEFAIIVPMLDLFVNEGGERRFKNWFRDNVIHYVECHEADEWLLYQGERDWDPHRYYNR